MIGICNTCVTKVQRGGKKSTTNLIRAREYEIDHL